MKQRTNINGSGENRQAIEELILEVVERYGQVNVHDKPLVERARTLASAVDSRPDDSQLAIQYASAVRELREQVLSAAEDRFKAAIWKSKTGCDEHPQFGDSHCGICCAEKFGDDHIGLYEAPMRTGAQSDTEYARMVLFDFLRYGK